MKLQVLILAGGFGKRLRPLTEDRPKPLIQVGSKTIIEWQIEWLRSQGIEEIILAVNKLSGVKIFEKLGDGSDYGVKIYYSVEKQPLGTGGAVKNAVRYVSDDKFIVVYGDIITNMKLKPLIEKLRDEDAIMTIIPYKVERVEVILSNDYVVDFRERVINIDGGVYGFSRQTLKYFPDKCELKEMLPILAKMRILKAINYKDVYWRAINTLKDVEEVSREIDSIFKNLENQ